MNHLKPLAIATALVMSSISFNQQTQASECGLSCCIAAGVDGVGSNVGLTMSLQYDTMYMKTNKQGTTKIAPKQVIDHYLAPLSNTMGSGMSMYAVSTNMTMQKIAANFAYRMDEDNAFILTVPYLINDMEMMMGMKMPPMMGNPARTTYTMMKMDTIEGFGDMSLIYMRDVYKDADIRTRHRLSVGVGIKAPTGDHLARNGSGALVHMMMQTGTGSWDAFLAANGTMAFGEHEDGGALFLLSPSLFYQANTRNSLGYKVGNRLNYDLSARYRVTSAFNVKLDLNGISSESDSSDGTLDRSGLVAYQNPTRNVLDNVANTGLNSLFISPGFQWVVGDGFAVSGEYRIPVYQSVNGTQQVTDNWFFLRLSKAF
ncbi:hypothetical protein MMIC_P2296 [Mariprofundus micogutta]|uniref:Transporter n=1 Tax=Mariprofundus micogutta TaxID=1921010 RepID=A0A1L8CQY1_9PROT|nr:hypothetical protein [Mariprofundus micogutta]GAV21313.1 hypothetical protein MMIC_P2296 [Mariprofundus micogutta]